MNEALFTFHLLLCIAISWGACKLGRDGLLSWVVLQPILANLFVLKQISLFSMNVTCSDVYAVSAILGTNLLQEYYGVASAKKAVWLSFCAMLFFVAMGLIHLAYAPNGFDTTHASYQAILEQTPRLVIASIISFFCVQQVDIRFFAFLKNKLVNTGLRYRNCISLFVSQALDTLLFTFLGLWGLVENLGDIFFVSFSIKCSLACLLALLSPQTKKESHDVPI